MQIIFIYFFIYSASKQVKVIQLLLQKNYLCNNSIFESFIDLIYLYSSAIAVVRYARVFVLPCAINYLYSFFLINYSLTNTVNEPKCVSRQVFV